MCNTLNIKALELYCNIKKWNIELDTLVNNEHKNIKVPNSTDKGNVIRNVPHLRFPEFEGEWEDFLINDVCSEFKSGKNIKADSISESGEYPVYGGNGLRGYTSSYNHEGLYVLIGRQGALCGNVRSVHGKTFITEHAIAVAGNEISNTSFLHYLFVKMNLGQYSDQSAQPGLAVNKLLKIKVVLPSVSEQTKIARFLSLLDERITTQNKIIEDLKKLKYAISHILFSSKFTNHLSYIANVVMGQSPSSNAYNDQGIGMPLVQGNLDISNGKTTPRLYTSEFNQTAEEGNIILTVRAPVGEVAKATKNVCLGRGVCAIIPHEENMSDFIYQYLTFYKFMWRKYEQGSTFTSINGSDVRNILCPEVRNVSILTLLDSKISTEERVVKLYQKQKQYLLRQMFI